MYHAMNTRSNLSFMIIVCIIGIEALKILYNFSFFISTLIYIIPHFLHKTDSTVK